MTTATLIAPYYTETLLDRESGSLITCSRVLSDAEALANLLPDTPMVTHLAKDRCRFLVGFIAALVRRQTMLLPSRRMPDALGPLDRDHATTCYLVDDAEQVEHLPSYQTPQCRLNPTCTAKVPRIPIHQPAVLAFTSDSTGHPHSYSNTWGSLVTVPRSAGSQPSLKASDPMTLVVTVHHQHAHGLETSVMHPLYSKGDS